MADSRQKTTRSEPNVRMKEDTDVRPMASAAMVMRFRMRSRGAEHTGCSAGGHWMNCSRGTGGVNISVPL